RPKNTNRVCARGDPMRIGIPREKKAGEARVAATPEMAKRYVAAGHEVLIESGAGALAHYTDQAYIDAGARCVDAATALSAELVLSVRAPQPEALALMRRGGVLAGMLDPFDHAGLQRLADAGLTAFALEAAPRITRAQSLD